MISHKITLRFFGKCILFLNFNCLAFRTIVLLQWKAIESFRWNDRLSQVEQVGEERAALEGVAVAFVEVEDVYVDQPQLLDVAHQLVVGLLRLDGVAVFHVQVPVEKPLVPVMLFTENTKGSEKVGIEIFVKILFANWESDLGEGKGGYLRQLFREGVESYLKEVCKKDDAYLTFSYSIMPLRCVKRMITVNRSKMMLSLLKKVLHKKSEGIFM